MSYTFDPSGTLPANKIVNELHTISGVDGISVNYVIPEFSPFFYDSLVIIDPTTSNELVPDVDYFPIYDYEVASSRINRRIVGGIAYTDPSRTGTYKFGYRTLGTEEFNVRADVVREALDLLENLNNIPLESIADVPEVFPLEKHVQPLSSVEGINAILNAFAELKTAFENRNVKIRMQDIVDFNSEFITPIVTHLATMAGKIEDIAVNRAITGYARSNAGTIENYNNPTPDAWIDSSLIVNVTVTANYLIDYTPFFAATWAGNAGSVDFRWVVNGVALSNAMARKTLVHLTSGDEVKIQFRVRDEIATAVQLSSENRSTDLIMILSYRG